MQNPFKHSPDPRDQLALYRERVKLDSPFVSSPRLRIDEKETLRAAILSIWDNEAERELGIHLPTFLKYIAKEIPTLRQLLQLASQACAPITLTEAALELVDLAYSMSDTTLLDDDCALPRETLKLPSGGDLLLYEKHHELPADATVCVCTDTFALPPGNYRSYRINALAGPRLRRDCALIKQQLSARPWAIATRGYHLQSQFVVHCRQPYLDSDLSIRQRLHLREAYMDMLVLASAIGAKTISLPLISTRGSGSTAQKAYRTAIEAIYATGKMGWVFGTVHLTGINPGTALLGTRSANGLSTFLPQSF